MKSYVKTLLGLALVALALSTPVLTGAASGHYLVGYLIIEGVVVLALIFFSRRAESLLAWRLVLSLCVFCVTLTCADILLRPILAPILYYRPDDRYFQAYPPMPHVPRYSASVSYNGPAYGELAAMSGDPRLRQPRHVRFVTDALGFRNDPADLARQTGPLDVIILGDSFGAGSGTTQEQTWASLLRNRYGVVLYNLSMPGSPWQEYANLALELPRLPVRNGTIVVWTLFTGNDLDELDYDPDLNHLPWRGPFGREIISYNTFRHRSPVAQILERLWYLGQPHPIITRVLDHRRPTLFFTEYVSRKDRTVEGVRRHPYYPALVRTFGMMVSFTKEKHLQLAVVIAPSKAEAYSWLLDGRPPWSTSPAPSGFAAVVQELSDRDGIPFLDLKPRLIEASKTAYEQSGEIVWWDDDTHWNPRGHEVVAAEIYDRIVKPLLHAQQK